MRQKRVESKWAVCAATQMPASKLNRVTGLQTDKLDTYDNRIYGRKKTICVKLMTGKIVLHDCCLLLIWQKKTPEVTTAVIKALMTLTVAVIQVVRHISLTSKVSCVLAVTKKADKALRDSWSQCLYRDD